MKHLTACAALALATPVLAQPSFAELKQKTDDITNLIAAENAKSELCARYVGTVVTPTTFDALAQTLPKIAAKGEYETTSQYEARKAAALSRAPTGLSVLVLPTDRDYARYEADDETLFVQAGAFQAGAYSPNVKAQFPAWSAVARGVPEGTGLFVSDSQRLVRTYTAQNAFGASFRVSVIDRNTKALHLTTEQLFPFAKFKSSPIMGMRLPLAKAPQVRQTFKVALVLQPVAPFVVTGMSDEFRPTVREPQEYTDRVTLLVAQPKCGLVLASTMHVLASADA
ncbi:hypothetical protein [Novosphingobium colocasiae]|uniref:hypothetical protein n=1 Tax=Novosphingobium colocasiae TaxID=1256513 RepID=UPI0035AFFA69